METVALTLGEAAAVLDPPVTEQQLRAIIAALGWKPAGWRRTGKPGHPAPEYPSADLMGLHAALAPFMREPRELTQNRLRDARMGPWT